MTKLALGVFPREPTSDSICSKQKQEIEHLEGRSIKLFNWLTCSSPTDNRTNLEWVVSSPAAGQVELTVRAQRAGTLRRTISLGGKECRDPGHLGGGDEQHSCMVK
jgi:hypothetical protein